MTFWSFSDEIHCCSIPELVFARCCLLRYDVFVSACVAWSTMLWSGLAVLSMCAACVFNFVSSDLRFRLAGWLCLHSWFYCFVLLPRSSCVVYCLLLWWGSAGSILVVASVCVLFLCCLVLAPAMFVMLCMQSLCQHIASVLNALFSIYDDTLDIPFVFTICLCLNLHWLLCCPRPFNCVVVVLAFAAASYGMSGFLWACTFVVLSLKPTCTVMGS